MSALKSVRNEDLRVGDMVDLWCGRARVTAIEPYTGPLADIIFAVARVDTDRGFSLERGGYTSIVTIGGAS